MTTRARSALLRQFAARKHKQILGGSGPVDTVVSASQSLVQLASPTVVTGSPVGLTITARNAAGQALAGKVITSVTLAPPGSGSVSGSGNTDGSGVASRTITAGDVGTGNTVTVVCDGVSLATVPTFDVTSAPAGAGFWSADFWSSNFWTPNFWTS